MFPPISRAVLPALILSCALHPAACGYYSTSATGGGSFKSIAVPLFKNQTLEHGLEENVTRAVVDAFVADNHLAVVDQAEAQTVLWGTLTEYRRIPFTFDAQGAVIEYKLEIVAKVEYEDPKNAKMLWTEDDLRAWATYTLDPAATAQESGEEPGEIAASEEEGRTSAIEKLARELVAKAVGGW